MRRIAVLDAPSNLGLRPPTATSVPGCAKAPGALRDHGLIPRLAARDAGCVTPPRYDPGDWRPGDGVAHAAEIEYFTRRLAERIEAIVANGEFPVVLGGDCSILLGGMLAMRRRSSDVDGRIGLVFVDGHSDFRHPGNASYVGAAAGEDLALVTGRGQADLAAIDNLRPYVHDHDVVVLGIRTHDEYRLDLQAAGIAVRAVPQLRAEGASRCAQWARAQLRDCIGYWVHVDVDVLDPAVMPAVDAPDPGGIAYTELELLLAGLVTTPECIGVEITVFDPDYDPTGAYAQELVQALVSGLTPASTVGSLDWDEAAARAAAQRRARREASTSVSAAATAAGAATTERGAGLAGTASAPDDAAGGEAASSDAPWGDAGQVDAGRGDAQQLPAGQGDTRQRDGEPGAGGGDGPAGRRVPQPAPGPTDDLVDDPLAFDPPGDDDPAYADADEPQPRAGRAYPALGYRTEPASVPDDEPERLISPVESPPCGRAMAGAEGTDLDAAEPGAADRTGAADAGTGSPPPRRAGSSLAGLADQVRAAVASMEMSPARTSAQPPATAPPPAAAPEDR